MSPENYERAIEGFAEKLLTYKAQADPTFTSQGLQNLVSFLSVLIDPTKRPEELFPGTQKVLKDEIRNLCYRYSHKKLEEFLVLPEMRFFFTIAFDPSSINQLISKNQKLNKTPELYRRCAGLILERVEKFNNPTLEEG